jgi:acetyl-CoA synthetase
MTRGFLNDSERYLETYFSRWPDVWFHGDWASVDADGFWFIHGRADDTIKVAGKRTGPAEIEAALIAHPEVAEAAAVGVPDPIRGEAVVCFVVVRAGAERPADLAAELGAAVVRALGKTLRPERIHFVAALPKTRSGKIVRGAIKRHYLAQPPGDTSSVENPEALSAIPRRA